MNCPELLAAVLAAPDDDLPRLIYADWLDEHGESNRATFIREQIRTGGSHRSHIMFNTAHAAWSARRIDYDSVVMQEPITHGICTHRRGFIEEILCAAEDWIANADRIIESNPIRLVRMTNMPSITFGKAEECTTHADQGAPRFWREYRFSNDRGGVLFHGRPGPMLSLTRLALEHEWPRIEFICDGDVVAYHPASRAGSFPRRDTGMLRRSL